MLFFKKAIHILVILILTFSFGFFIIKILGVVVGLDLNNFILYKDNYSKSSGKIVIVKIDNKSLDNLQKTNLSILNIEKQIYIDLIEKLNNFKVKAIGFDLVFANISDNVSKLEETVQKYGNIVIGAKIGQKGNEEYDRVLPLPIFNKNNWGAIDMDLDKNVVKSMKPYSILDNEKIESFSIKLYRKYINNNSNIGKIEDSYYHINPLKKIPIANNLSILINFFNPPKGYPSYSLIDVLDNKIDPEIFRDKIVLIGEYGALIHDSHFSPLDSTVKMPGVEFHANMIDSILQNKYLQSQSQSSELIFIFIITFLFVILFFFLHLKYSIILFLLYFIFSTLIGRYLLSQNGLYIDLFNYFVYIFIAFLVTYIYKFLIVDKNRRHIEHAFSHYLSKDIVDKISQDSRALSLGGEKRRITIFFSDIVSFTAISEHLGTEKIFQLLSEYLSEMTDILISNKGTLDKYIGDAVMGFFNAPIIIDNPEYQACKTAIEQQERLKKLNLKWIERGFPALSIRIGIDSGEAMVGNIGSKDRFNYTVIGDHVNLASRLEGVNKEYLTKICVSEGTYLSVKNDFIFRELDTIRVKGKKEGIKIYELISFAGDNSINLEVLKKYEQGLYLYYQGKYIQAKEVFEENIFDLPSSIMLLRCQNVLDGKILVKDGIYEMKTK